MPWRIRSAAVSNRATETFLFNSLRPSQEYNMPQPKIDSCTLTVHIMVYALGCTGAVCFAVIAYLESLL